MECLVCPDQKAKLDSLVYQAKTADQELLAGRVSKVTEETSPNSTNCSSVRKAPAASTETRATTDCPDLEVATAGRASQA